MLRTVTDPGVSLLLGKQTFSLMTKLFSNKDFGMQKSWTN